MKNSQSSDTDRDLLGYMAMKADDPEGASVAWEQFVKRHSGYLNVTLKKRRYHYHLGGLEHLEDLIQDTFIRVFERADTFESDASDPDELRRIVRSWLGTIARRIFYDRFQAIGEDQMEEFEEESLSESFFTRRKDQEITSKVMKLGLDAWDESLNEKDREVLVATGEFQQFGKSSQRMPNGVARALADSHGTTTAGMRMRRSRAIKKLVAYVEERLNQRKPS